MEALTSRLEPASVSPTACGVRSPSPQLRRQVIPQPSPGKPRNPRPTYAVSIKAQLKMAEAVGVASGVLTLAAFAFKSSVALYQTVKNIHHHPDTVRDLQQELEALQAALRSLTETVGATSEADFSALNLPLKRCGTACHEFEQKLLSSVSRSGSALENFRGWARLRYLGDDVDSFRRMLAGYKSIILIAITDMTLYVFPRSLYIPVRPRTRPTTNSLVENSAVVLPSPATNWRSTEP